MINNLFAEGVVLSTTQCPACAEQGGDSSKDNLTVYDNGIYCFACGMTAQKNQLSEEQIETYYRNVTTIPNKQYLPLIVDDLKDVVLKSRHIPSRITKKYGVKAHNGKVVFPYYKNNVLVAQKIRCVPKKEYSTGNIREADMFGQQMWGKAYKKLIITEGEFDALAVASLVHDSIHVTTLSNGIKSVKNFITKHYNRLAEYDEIVLCFDQDDHGRAGAEEFQKLFTVKPVTSVKISEKDACDMLVNGKDQELKWAVMNASRPKPAGIVCIGDMTLDDFQLNLKPGLPTMFPKLNAALGGGLRKGELTMFTAGTGMGKSTCINNIIYDFIVNKDQKVADVKLEENSLKTRYQYLAMYNDLPPRDVGEQISEIDDSKKLGFITKFKNLYLFNQFGSIENTDLLVLLDYCATVLGADYLFLDHITIAAEGLELRGGSLRHNMQKLVVKLREMIDRTGVGIGCVCHLSRPPKEGLAYDQGRRVNRTDLKEASSLEQISDNIIAIEGDLSDESIKDQRVIHLIKSRYGNEQEVYCDKFKWDIFTGKIKIVN